MDCQKVGELIRSLRLEQGMTQRQLAESMNISDKAISKWERGLGCPDISLLHELSEALGVNIEKILLGDLEPNRMDGGNMKRLKFYNCSTCGNILTSTGDAEVSCCGRKLSPLSAKPGDGEHRLVIEEIEDEYLVTFNHEMTKAHYLNFIAYVTFDRVLLVRLYPEQGNEVRLPGMSRGKLYFSCNQHGLWVTEI